MKSRYFVETQHEINLCHYFLKSYHLGDPSLLLPTQYRRSSGKKYLNSLMIDENFVRAMTLETAVYCYEAATYSCAVPSLGVINLVCFQQFSIIFNNFRQFYTVTAVSGLAAFELTLKRKLWKTRKSFYEGHCLGSVANNTFCIPNSS